MITLKLLRWGNCFSYGSDNELYLDNAIVTQLVGGNGTGKSSIPLIIFEVLYNKNSKGTKKAKIPNRYLNVGYYIYLMWEKDEDLYEITVNRDTNLKVKLLKNGNDISSHTATNTYKTVQDILGMDFKTFSQLVYQSTKDSLQFLTATDTNRKKFLIDLLHLEEYVKLFEVFKEAAKKVNSKVTGLEATLTTLEKWLTDNKLTDTTILPMLNLDIDTEENEKELRYVTKELENILEKNKKIIKNNQLRNLLGQINLQEAEAIQVTNKKSYDSLQKELGEEEAEVARCTKMLNKLESLGDHCPTCEQEISVGFKVSLISEEKANLVKYTRKSKRLKEEINDIKQNNTLVDTKAEIQRRWEDLFRSVDKSLPTLLLDEVQLTVRMECIQAELLQAKKLLAENARDNERRTKHNTRIQVIQEQTASFMSELNETQAMLDEQVLILSNLEVLKKSFSTNGLLAYKIENLVKELEQLTNTYLGDLSDGRFTIEFVVTNDKLNVQITDDGFLIDIEDLSTGELGKVNTATLIAIRKLMSSISKSRINVLFLDEVISVLDEEGREKLVEVLLKEDLNTYVVSHEWTHPLLEKIEVVKEDKISRLEK